MKPEEIAALYKLNMLYGEKLPGIAMAWVESGMDSQALIELAWEHSPTMRDAAPLLEKGLQDICVDIPTRERALVLLQNIYCKQILNGDVIPFEGANSIWQKICTEDEAPNSSSEFGSLAEALQNTRKPEFIEKLNSRIVSAAKKFVIEVNV